MKILRQGELDYSCGAYCVINAAMVLRKQSNGWEIWSDAMKALWRSQRDVAYRIQRQVFAEGLWERDLHALADAAQLQFTAVRAPSFERLADAGPGTLHIVLLKMDFASTPKPTRMGRNARTYKDWHYVLVLGIRNHKARIADSHPLHKGRSWLGEKDFNLQWTQPRGRRWAARLTLPTVG